MDLKSRFGKLFILVGVILLLLFVAADMVEVEDLNAWYLLSGVVFTAFGIFLSIAGRRPPEESARFRTLRKITRRGKDDKKNGEEEGE